MQNAIMSETAVFAVSPAATQGRAGAATPREGGPDWAAVFAALDSEARAAEAATEAGAVAEGAAQAVEVGQTTPHEDAEALPEVPGEPEGAAPRQPPAQDGQASGAAGVPAPSPAAIATRAAADRPEAAPLKASPPAGATMSRVMPVAAEPSPPASSVLFAETGQAPALPAMPVLPAQAAAAAGGPALPLQAADRAAEALAARGPSRPAGESALPLAQVGGATVPSAASATVTAPVEAPTQAPLQAPVQAPVAARVAATPDAGRSAAAIPFFEEAAAAVAERGQSPLATRIIEASGQGQPPGQVLGWLHDRLGYQTPAANPAPEASAAAQPEPVEVARVAPLAAPRATASSASTAASTVSALTAAETAAPVASPAGSELPLLITEPRHALPLASHAALSQAPAAGPAMAQQVAAQIAEISRPLPDGPVELSLHPEELGRLKLSFSGGEAGLHVVVAAERPETLEMMRRHIEVLAQEMRRLGHEGAQFSFAGGESAFDQQAGTGQEDARQVSWTGQGDGPMTGLSQPDAAPGLRLGSAGLDLRL